MLHISLFSGIGGFDLAAQWAGWTNIVSCEINPFGRRHLEYYWPEAYHHDDIHTLNIERINEQLTKRFGADWRTDDIVLTGGFPCQPYSLAGKRLGKEDDRHLWPEMLRVIREVRPTYIVGENVFGLVNWSDGLVFNEVQTDLEAEGYEVQSFVLPACATDAPHRRDRLWIIAHSNDIRGGKSYESEKQQRRAKTGTTSEGFNNKDATNAVRNGQQRSYSKHEVNTSERGEYAQRDIEQGVKHVIVTNAANIGQEQSRNAREWRSGFADCDSNAGWDATNANSKRHEERDTSSEPSEQKRQHCEKNPKFRLTDWHDFPTQSPVCTRNDGIPAGLDGITFPKWRNESIKAAGNAVVPQVVLKIFEAINAIHHTP